MRHQISLSPYSIPARAQVTTVPGSTVQAANMDQYKRPNTYFRTLFMVVNIISCRKGTTINRKYSSGTLSKRHAETP